MTREWTQQLLLDEWDQMVENGHHAEDRYHYSLTPRAFLKTCPSVGPQLCPSPLCQTFLMHDACIDIRAKLIHRPQPRYPQIRLPRSHHLIFSVCRTCHSITLSLLLICVLVFTWGLSLVRIHRENKEVGCIAFCYLLSFWGRAVC